MAARFKAISVREASGVGLCKEYLGMEVQHVLDPTMLLTAEKYLALTGENDYPQGRYIATYILDSNPAKKKSGYGRITRIRPGRCAGWPNAL